MKILVDFDGTVVDWAYPKIGMEAPDAIRTLRDLVSVGHQLILSTMRDGKHLDEAVQWFTDNQIELYGSQTDPDQSSWTASPKCYAEKYIGDDAVGCPMIHPVKFKRPCVDWSSIRHYFGLNSQIRALEIKDDTKAKSK